MNGSPWDVWAAVLLIVFAGSAVVAIFFGAVCDARRAAYWRRVADRQVAARRRLQRPVKGARYGVCGAPLCTSGAVVRVGVVWFCFDCAASRLAEAAPFDLSAVELEEWLNGRGRAS